MGKNFSIDTSKLNTDAVMNIRASHLKSNEKRPYYELIFPVYDLNSIQYQKLLGTCVFVLEPESFDDTLQNAQSTEHAVVFLLDSLGLHSCFCRFITSPAEVRWHLRSCTALPKNIFHSDTFLQ